MWGLQRPPLGTVTELRVDRDTTVSDVALHLLPFHMTNARDQIGVSVHPDNSTVLDFIKIFEGGKYLSGAESVGEFESRVQQEDPWNVVYVRPTTEYPLVGHFVARLFPLGHIKSVKSNDAVRLYCPSRFTHSTDHPINPRCF